MKKACLPCALFLVLPVFAAAVPHWISVMPLRDDWREADVVSDAVGLGERTVIDGIAFSCPVNPEGDPVADKAAHYARRFCALAPQIRKGSSVRTGILMQATMGHGGEPGSRTPWQLAVHADGKVTYRFCPLDPRFLDYIARTCRTLSAAKPDFFMVDDDTRLIWKKPGCFCPLHLAAFAERTGRAWTREEVVAKLDAGDREVTEKWLSLKAESLAGFFRTVRANYDPSIPGILCACGAEEHMRHAREYARILAAPGQVPMVRGNGAPYCDTTLEAITWLRSSYAAQRAFVGDGVDYLQESDTCPHTRWGASATALVNEMVMLALEGVKGAKVWITRSEPDEGRSRAAYRRAFRENRGLMEWAAKTDFRQRGFVIPQTVTNAYSVGVGSWGARYFSRAGIPYRIGAPAKGEVAALSGETVDNLTDAQLRELLSGLVLLDGTAAIRLTERGFAADIGVEAKPWTGRTVQRQEFADGRRLGRGLVVGSADLSRTAAGATVRSRLFNRPKLGADFEPIAPGSVLFTNARGGRVYSFAQALVELRPIYHASAMYSETYRDEVVKAGAELAGTIPGGAYYLGDEPMMFEIGETDADGTVFVLDNLELDADDALEIAFAEPPVAIERLRASDGSWQPVRFTCGSNGVCRLETVVRTEEPAVFRVRLSAVAAVLTAGNVDIWPKSLQEECPKTYEAFGVTNGIRTLFYENVPYRGKETRVFAYLGVPKTTDGKPVPGMVLVHGGGGSAYHRWVKYWNDRGYAAIAMDWNGCVSRDVKGQRSHERHPWAGPEGCHSWNDIDAPVGDQWPYHAVAAILRAHTLLAATPGVDAGRIGLTGISWGGYLSCIASGVDPRFRFVAPVYGCGFISEHSMWRDDGYTDGRFPTCDPKKIERYNALWDPKNFLGKAKMPFFFIDSANDHAYPLDILEKSRALVTSPVTRLTIPKYPHCHGEASERPREIFDYADGLFGRGPRLPRCTSMGVRNWAGDIVAKFDLGDEEIASASFCCTYGHGDCREREWEELPATFSNDTVKVSWPADNYTGFFFSIVTKRGNRVTSDAVLAPGLVPGLVKHLAIDPTKENLRNGEGDTVMLKDGRMLFAYSHFTNHSSTNNHQSGGTDGYSASIYGWISPDGGRTWPGEPRELIQNDAGLNLMCVSFLRLRDGSLAMFYLKKNGDDDCRPVMRVSKDEGETWGEARYCIDEAHRQYYVMNNARVIRLGSGRILLPLCLHRYTAGAKKGGFGSANEPNGEVLSAWSDDDGATWRISDSVKAVLEGKQRAAQEPGVVELRDGRVLMYIRSGGQRQRLLYSYSSDGGESWSAPEPGPVSSPTAPATMARLSSGELVMVYNCHDGANKALWEYRTPLVIAVSEDEGRTWTRQRSIADSLTDHGNCYASVREYDGRLYVSYYAHYVLRHLRLKSFPVSSVLAWPKKDDGAAKWKAAVPVWPEGESETLNSHFAFEAPFTYAAGRPKPTLRVTAAYTYRVTLNGRFVGYGPVRAPKDVYRVDTWTLDAAPGENRLVIEAAGYRCNNYCFIDQEPFLQAEVLDGARVLAATGARGGFTARRTGRIARVPRFSAQRTFVEAWRVGGERGPELPLGAQKAKRCEERPIAVPDFRIDGSYRPIRRERLVPAPAKEIVRNGFIEPRPGGRQHVRYPVDTLETNPYYDLQRHDYAADAKKGTTLAAGESLVYEGDVNRAGFLGLRVRTDGPARIVVAFDEILSGDGRLDFTRLGCANVVEWRIERAGEWTLESFEPYAAKYQRVAVLEGTAEVRGVFVRTYLSPLTARARFRASDPALGRIFDAAAESYRANAVDGFTDCPIRERAYWTGDTFFTARASRYLTGDASPEALFLGNFFRPEPFDWSRYDSHGVDMSLAIPALYPGGITGSNFIPNYMLWTVLQTAEYVREFGDRDFALRAKERLLGILEFFRRFRNSDGLLEKLPGWVFIEWSKANELVQDVNYPSSMMYAAALAAVADLYAMPELAAEAAAVRREIVRQSWNGRWFCDNAVRQADGTLKLSGECTETCQYCAFFFGTVTPESHPELWTRLLDEFGPDRAKAGRYPEIWPCNFIFGTCQRLELLSRADRARQIVEETRNRFLPMAERTGTLWEHLDERASCCHGFCAVAAEYLMRDVLGVRAIDRLSQKVKLRLPEDMPLDWVEATVPLTSASVAEIAWRKGPDGVPKYEIKLPEGWESEQAVLPVFGCASIPETCVPTRVPDSAQNPYWAGEGYWNRRHAAKLAEIAAGPKDYDCVFVGDSITHNWEGWSDPIDVEKVTRQYEKGRLKFPNGPGRAVWEELKGKYALLNLGIGGDSTQHVLWRLENGEMDGYRTRFVMLMIGANNGQPAADIAAGVKACVAGIAQRHPEACILLSPIFPSHALATDPRRLVENEVNAEIRKLADGKKVVWVDFNKRFLTPDGTLTREMMPDLLHPLEPGYRIWREAIEPYLETR